MVYSIGHLRNVGQSPVQPGCLVGAQPVDDLLETAAVDVQTQEVEEKPFAWNDKPLKLENSTLDTLPKCLLQFLKASSFRNRILP